MLRRLLPNILALLTCTLAHAQTAGTVGFQGRLKQNGSPVSGSVTLQFRIFDAQTNGNLVDMDGDGTPEDVVGQDVTERSLTGVVDGLVSTKFGPVHPMAFDGSLRWLQITVNPPSTPLSRLEMATAPATAEQLNRPGTGTGAVFVDGAGNAGIGTSTPAAKLDVAGDGVVGGLLSLGRSTPGNPGSLDLFNAAGGNRAFQVYIASDGSARLAGGDDIGRNFFELGRNANNGAAFLNLYGVNGSPPTIGLGGNPGGGQISLFNGQPSNQETITLDGNNSGGGAITMRNASGFNVARLRRHPNESGVLDLNRDDGSAGITLEGNGSSGAGGGFIHIRSATTSSNTISLIGNDGTGGGYVSITNGETTNLETIKLDGNNSSGAGELWVRGGSASSGEVELLGDSSGRGGRLVLRNAAGTLKIDMYADIGTGQSRIVADCFAGTVGCDLAESFDLTDRDHVKPGDVLMMDAAKPGHLTLSTRAYDKKVAGIVSGAGGLQPGVKLGTRSDGSDDLPIALSGRVYCYVDATRYAVEIGDLLTTSDTPGHAMKVTDFARSQGAVLGKAMEPLAKGKKRLILVLVGLQ